MNKPYPLPLRVMAYNRQFKNNESLIFLKEGADPNEASSYTSLLYQRYLGEGAALEREGGLYLFSRKIIHPAGMLIRALTFLQVLFYLEYYDELRKKRLLETTALIKKYHEEQKAKKLAKEQEETKGFELEEREGVTFIKNTNFVLSKLM
ncbi:hypothetical protein [Rufibacter aurantiacus]|uniref:hypothetical protein n=1 Tax=Rufibacter aurantiacus TaxID=2817374 RepID=UPI001B31245B|nr:hypothetical protein [Rufibacter aurantiacus]